MMNQPFRIEQKEAFRVLGYAVQTTNRRREAGNAIAAHWAHFKQEHLNDALLQRNDQSPFGLFGISVYNTDETDSRKFEYYIAVSSRQPSITNLSEYVVPAGTWAVFPCTVETIAKTEVQAITKWLPRSNYRPLNSGYLMGRMKSGAPDIEYYGNDGLVEVWVAVKKK